MLTITAAPNQIILNQNILPSSISFIGDLLPISHEEEKIIEYRDYYKIYCTGTQLNERTWNSFLENLLNEITRENIIRIDCRNAKRERFIVYLKK